MVQLPITNYVFYAVYAAHRDLELWPFDPKTWSTHLCPAVHLNCEFGENPSNTFQISKYRVTMFGGGACTDA